MIKHIFITALITTLIAPSAYADHKHGPRNECWRDSKYDKHWAYYYCGAQAAKCDGKKSKGHDTVFWQYHGDHFTFRTSPRDTYWCCGGTKSDEGKYVSGKNWIVKTETETKSVDGGTCTVKIETDICGGVNRIDCDTPGKCNAGYILRNGVCTQLCPDGSAFESIASNNCIECETTNYQGIKIISGENKLCVKCDKDTQYFDKNGKRCMSKSELTQIPKSALNKCWGCPDTETFKQCVDIVQRPVEALNFRASNESSILARCHVDQSSLESIMKAVENNN